MSEKSHTFVALKGWGKAQEYSLRHVPFYICILYENGSGLVVAPIVMVAVSLNQCTAANPLRP